MLSETSSTSTRKIPPTTSPGAQDPTIPDPLVVGGIQKANKNIPHLGQHRRGPDATTKWRRFFLVILPCRLWRHNNTRVETVQGSLVIQFRAKMMTWYVMICINYQLFQKKNVWIPGICNSIPTSLHVLFNKKNRLFIAPKNWKDAPTTETTRRFIARLPGSGSLAMWPGHGDFPQAAPGMRWR